LLLLFEPTQSSMVVRHSLDVTCACPIDRDLDNEDDLLFGVHKEMLYARNSAPVPGAQWTGIVTQIAIDMLESGAVEAVVCVQSQDGDRFAPKPVRKLALHSANIRICKNPPAQNDMSLTPVQQVVAHRLLMWSMRCLRTGGGAEQGGHPGRQGREADAEPQPQRAGHRGGAGRQAAAVHRRRLPGELRCPRLGPCMQVPLLHAPADIGSLCVARSWRCAASKSTCSWTSCMCSGYAVRAMTGDSRMS
jgi:Coenzyme F420 hydrogenase/dehydrogenase, beta subunit N-term